MATFLKTTEISIDGARTLPRRYYTSPEIFSEELEQIFTEALALRRARGPDPQAGRLFPAADRQGEHHRAARPRRRLPGVLQRLPPPRHPALRGAHRPVLRDDPVSLPCLDLRARRPAHRGALDQETSRASTRPTGRSIPCGVATWEGFLFINLAEEPEPFERGVGSRCSAGSAGSTCRISRWRRTIEYDVRANWKLLFQNYSECYHCGPVHPPLAKLTPAHQRGERPDRGTRSPAGSW